MGKRMVSLLLALIMTLGLFPSAAISAFATESAALENGMSILTAFSAEDIALDGKITDGGWQMHDLGNGLSIGAQWQKKTLYLAASSEVSSLVVNGVTVPLTEGTEGVSVFSGSTYTELAISMAYLHLLTESVRATQSHWLKTKSLTSLRELVSH